VSLLSDVFLWGSSRSCIYVVRVLLACRFSLRLRFPLVFLVSGRRVESCYVVGVELIGYIITFIPRLQVVKTGTTALCRTLHGASRRIGGGVVSCALTGRCHGSCC
jgi:hypothetical protein